MRWIRRLVYRAGVRPRYPSIFYSPTLEILYGFSEAKPKNRRQGHFRERFQK